MIPGGGFVDGVMKGNGYPAVGAQGAGADEESSDAYRVLSDTFVPGVYDLVRKPEAASEPDPSPLDRFVVNYDHVEDDMAELSADDRARLIVHDRVRFATSLDDLRERMYGSESRTELWALLILIFPCLLIGELVLTRRMVRHGHSGIDAA